MDVVVVNVLRKNLKRKKILKQVKCLNTASLYTHQHPGSIPPPSKHSFCLLLGAHQSQA